MNAPAGTRTVSGMAWAERAADRSPLVQQWRSRNVRQMQIMVEAARRLIARKGSSFTTQELAREAGVAVQTFYRHFGGKDQLLLATIEDLHVTQAAEYERAAGDLPDPLARLHYYVTAVLTSLDTTGPAASGPQFITAEHWRLHQLFPDEMTLATQPVTDLFARELESAREQGLITLPDVRQGADLMVTLVRSVYHQYAFARKDESAAELAERVWQFCLQGIGGRTGGKEDPT